MAMKWCTKLDVALKRCPIVFQGHLSNFKVTRLKKSSILTQIRRFRTVTPVWIHQWLWNDTQSLKQHRRGALAFFKVIRQISRSHRTKNADFDPSWGFPDSWWRHQMETFSALLAICAGNSPVPGELPAQRPVTRSFDVFFDLRLNKWPSKQWWGWWFETLSRPLWCHCNGNSSWNSPMDLKWCSKLDW